jgi:hypothetical protein
MMSGIPFVLAADETESLKWPYDQAETDTQ